MRLIFFLRKLKDIVFPYDVDAFGIIYKASWSGGVFFSACSCSSCLVSLLACDTRPNAVLKAQKFAFAWRSTAW